MPKGAHEVSDFVSDVIFGIRVHVIEVLLISGQNWQSFDESPAVFEHEKPWILTRIYPSFTIRKSPNVGMRVFQSLTDLNPSGDA